MKTKEATIAGVKVMLAYCYATEIIFRDFSGDDFQNFILSLAPGEDGRNHTDPKKLLYAILAAITAYYQYKDEEPPIKDNDIMYSAAPKDLVEAFSVVMQLHNEWYKIPVGEPKPEENKKGKKQKN